MDDVVALLRQVLVTLVDAVKFFDGAEVWRPQLAKLAFELGDAALGGGRRFDLGTGVRRGGAGELVGVPQLVDDLLLLQLCRELFLLQAGAFTLHI